MTDKQIFEGLQTAIINSATARDLYLSQQNEINELKRKLEITNGALNIIQEILLDYNMIPESKQLLEKARKIASEQSGSNTD